MLNLDELTNMINLLRDYILKIYFLEIIVVHRKGIKPYSYFGGERGGGYNKPYKEECRKLLCKFSATLHACSTSYSYNSVLYENSRHAFLTF